MIGAIIGDIVGSRFERHNYKAKDFELFTEDCSFTDDTVMTLAVAKTLLNTRGWHDDFYTVETTAVHTMQEVGLKHPNCGYGAGFRNWLHSKHPRPYNSYGNGAAMRISPVAYVTESVEDCIALSRKITKVTHNHPEGMKGAEVTALATWMMGHDYTKKDLKETVEDNEYYTLDFTIDNLRPVYRFDSSCDGTVPVAIQAFLESTDFEDAIRLAVSVGGDSDTIAAITGGIAGAFYGVPEKMRETAIQYLTPDLVEILTEFETAFSSKG